MDGLQHESLNYGQINASIPEKIPQISQPQAKKKPPVAADEAPVGPNQRLKGGTNSHYVVTETRLPNPTLTSGCSLDSFLRLKQQKEQNPLMGGLQHESLNSAWANDSIPKRIPQISQPQSKQNIYLATDETPAGLKRLKGGTNSHCDVPEVRVNNETLISAGSVDSFLLLKQRKEQSQELQQLERLGQLNKTPQFGIRSSSNITEPNFDGDLDENVGDLSTKENSESESVQQAKKKKTRGLTMMKDVQTRSLDQRKVIVLNEKNQPVGPDSNTMKEFSNFLGTVALKEKLAPLNYISWRAVPMKEQIWEFVKTKYIVPEEAKKWVLKAICDSWRTYKHRVKIRHFERYNTNQERREHRPKNISKEVFDSLLAFWNLKEVQKRERKERGNDEPLSLAEMFKATRKRKQGRVYKQLEQEVNEQMARIEELQFHVEAENSDSVAEITRDFIKPQSGRVRLFGRGVTPTDLKNDGLLQKSSLKVPAECIESIKLSLEQEIQQKFAAEKDIMDQKIDKLVSEKTELERKLEERS